MSARRAAAPHAGSGPAAAEVRATAVPLGLPGQPVLWRLALLARAHRRWLAVTLVSIVASGALMVLTPWLIGFAVGVGLDFDPASGVARGDMRTMLLAAALLLGAAALRSATVYAQSYLGERVSQQIAYDLRNRMFDHLQQLSFAYHDRAQTGDVMSRATGDVEAVRFFVSMGLVRLVYVAGLIAATAALMLATNWRVALVALAFIPLVAALAILTSNRLRPVWREIQDIQGDLANVLEENLSGQRVVKAFSREDFEQRKFDHHAQRMFDASYASTRFMAVTEPLMNSLWLVSLGAVFWIGGREVIAGRMAPEDILTFQLYLTMLQMPVRSLGFIVGIVARAHGAGGRIFDILDAVSAVRDAPTARPLAPGPGDVRFTGVSFGYAARSTVLRDIDLHAPPGTVVALLGPTGSGKTTVVNLLPRFYDATAGSVTLDGQDVREVTLASLRRAVGVVQQDVFLFADTIRANIAYGRPDATDAEIEAAARAARLHDFIASLPDGYRTWVGERGVTLSGGQKQRLSIARTLLMNPRVLVLDDATSSVDTRTEFLIQEALAEVMRGRTTFVIAQRLRTVQEADEILVLEDGAIVQRGTHEMLLAAEGPYRAIYDLELRQQEPDAEPGPHPNTVRDGDTLPPAAPGEAR